MKRSEAPKMFIIKNLKKYSDIIHTAGRVKNSKALGMNDLLSNIPTTSIEVAFNEKITNKHRQTRQPKKSV